jgi:hypothetical protein
MHVVHDTAYDTSIVTSLTIDSHENKYWSKRFPPASSSGKEEIAASTIVYFIRCAGGDDAGSSRRDGFSIGLVDFFSTKNYAFYYISCIS